MTAALRCTGGPQADAGRTAVVGAEGQERVRRLEVNTTPGGEPLLDARSVSRILENSASPYFYERDLLKFFREIFEIPPVRLAV